MKLSLFGQYIYKDTLIHELDPRVKVLSVVFISLFLFLLTSTVSFSIMSIFILLLILISRMKISSLLRNIRPFLFFFIFILLMYSLFSRNQLYQGVIVVWRFILLITIASILTFSTSISQLIYAIEKLFMPLKLIGISPRDLAVMVSATIRFIPLLFMEANKTVDAQKSRGANLKKLRHISALITTLLRKTFNRASNLADAMESRCYRDYSYTHLREFKLRPVDFIAILFIITITGVLLWIRI